MEFKPKIKAEVLRALRVFGRRFDLVIRTPAGGTIRVYAGCDKDQLKEVIANVRYRTWAADWKRA